MSEPAPTSNNTVIIVLLLLVCAALVYLDWRKGGEIELLHARIDTMVPPTPMRTAAPPPTTPPPTVPAPPAAPVSPVFVGDGEVLPGSAPIDQSVVVEPTAGPHPLIRATLQAHTDTEVDTIGRGQ